MAHVVRSVEELYNSSKRLLNETVLNGEDSADGIISNLSQAIENLKINWKGKDAGIAIQEVIGVHNAMVYIRNALAQLSVDSSKVAVDYRAIQNANRAKLEDLTTLHFEPKGIREDYTDTADTIYITEEANTGKKLIDTANNSFDSFKSKMQTVYNEIMDNWTEGTGRSSAVEAFETFMSNANSYKEILSNASSNITLAILNYKM